MFKKWLKALGLLFCLLVPAISGAQETLTPVAKQGHFARATKAVGHYFADPVLEFKTAPRIMKIFLVGTVLINATDGGTTCRALSVGAVESNPILGPRPSCGKVFGIGIITTSVQLGTIFKASKSYTETCYRHAADPNDPWNRVPAHTRDPESCHIGWPVGGMVGIWPLEGFIIADNIHAINAQEHYWNRLKH